MCCCLTTPRHSLNDQRNLKEQRWRQTRRRRFVTGKFANGGKLRSARDQRLEYPLSVANRRRIWELCYHARVESVDRPFVAAPFESHLKFLSDCESNRFAGVFQRDCQTREKVEALRLHSTLVLNSDGYDLVGRHSLSSFLSDQHAGWVIRIATSCDVFAVDQNY